MDLLNNIISSVDSNDFSDFMKIVYVSCIRKIDGIVHMAYFNLVYSEYITLYRVHNWDATKLDPTTRCYVDNTPEPDKEDN